MSAWIEGDFEISENWPPLRERERERESIEEWGTTPSGRQTCTPTDNLFDQLLPLTTTGRVKVDQKAVKPYSVVTTVHNCGCRKDT